MSKIIQQATDVFLVTNEHIILKQGDITVILLDFELRKGPGERLGGWQKIFRLLADKLGNHQGYPQSWPLIRDCHLGIVIVIIGSPLLC